MTAVRATRGLLIVAAAVAVSALLIGRFLYDFGDRCLPGAFAPSSVSPWIVRAMDGDCRELETTLASELGAIFVVAILAGIWLYRSRAYAAAADEAQTILRRATQSDVAWAWWAAVALASVVFSVVAKVTVTSSGPPDVRQTALSIALDAAGYWLEYAALCSFLGDDREEGPFWRYVPWATASSAVLAIILFRIIVTLSIVPREPTAEAPLMFLSLLSIVPWLGWSTWRGTLRFRA